MQSNRDISTIVIALQMAIIQEFETSLQAMGRGMSQSSCSQAEMVEKLQAYTKKLAECRALASQYVEAHPDERGKTTIYNLLMRKFKMGECGELSTNLAIDLTKHKIINYQISTSDSGILHEKTEGHAFVLFTTNENADKLSDELFGGNIFDFFKKLDDTYFVADPLLGVVFSVHRVPQQFRDELRINKCEKMLSVDWHGNFDVVLERLASFEKKADEEWNRLQAMSRVTRPILPRGFLQTSPHGDEAQLKQKATSIFNSENHHASAWKYNRKNNVLWFKMEKTEDNVAVLKLLREHIEKALREKSARGVVVVGKIKDQEKMLFSIKPASAVNHVAEFRIDTTNKPSALAAKS